MLRNLALQAPVHLVAFGDGGPVPPELSAICASVRLVPHRRSKMSAAAASLFSGLPASVEYFVDPAFKLAVNEALQRAFIRTIYAFSSQMAAYLPRQGPERIVLDMVDFDSAKFDDLAQIAGPAAAFAYRREARLLRRFECEAAQQADTILFISAAEAAAFLRHFPALERRVKIVANGVDTHHFRPSGPCASDPNIADILFVGQMDYRPNIDAVTHFAHAVMPVVRGHGIKARFNIVGRAPAEEVRALSQLPDICVHGEVPDVRPWLSQAAVVVAPLRVARGVQNKVLEAMACGRPVVATSHAAEGLDVVHGRDLLIADASADQASAIVDLIANPARASSLGESARHRVKTAYDWEASRLQLENIMTFHHHSWAA